MLCSVCLHYAHKECVSKHISSGKQKPRKHICIYSETKENTERDPFIGSQHFGDISDDENSQSITIKKLGLDKDNMTFNKVIKRLDKN